MQNYLNRLIAVVSIIGTGVCVGRMRYILIFLDDKTVLLVNYVTRFV